MQDSLLLKIALITGIVGIGFLVLILTTTGLQDIDISEAKELEQDKAVKITGTIERITAKEGFSIIDIKKQEEITVIVFEKVNLTKGQTIEVSGKIEEYKGEKEIIAEKVVAK